MNSRGCMTQTTVSGLPRQYRLPVNAALSAVRSTTLRVTVPSGTSRGLQSVLRKPAVTAAELVCVSIAADEDMAAVSILTFAVMDTLDNFLTFMSRVILSVSDACQTAGSPARDGRDRPSPAAAPL